MARTAGVTDALLEDLIDQGWGEEVTTKTAHHHVRFHLDEFFGRLVEVHATAKCSDAVAKK